MNSSPFKTTDGYGPLGHGQVSSENWKFCRNGMISGGNFITTHKNAVDFSHNRWFFTKLDLLIILSGRWVWWWWWWWLTGTSWGCSTGYGLNQLLSLALPGQFNWTRDHPCTPKMIISNSYEYMWAWLTEQWWWWWIMTNSNSTEPCMVAALQKWSSATPGTVKWRRVKNRKTYILGYRKGAMMKIEI